MKRAIQAFDEPRISTSKTGQQVIVMVIAEQKDKELVFCWTKSVHTEI